MSDVCTLVPTIKINNKERESKLFKDLTQMFAKRKDAIEIWSLAQIPGFMAKYGLKKVNGEYLAEDIKKALNFNEVLESKLSKDVIRKDNGFVDDENKPVTFKDFNEATRVAEQFNDKSKNYNSVVLKSDNGWSIDIEDKITGILKPSELKFNSTLNNKLLRILNDLGFDVEVIKELQQDGIFDPLNAELNAKGLINVIKLAQGKAGEEALPEEFAHLIISGLRKQPLVQRALESITDEQIKSVLGNDYENYSKIYKEQTLKEEVLGRLLADSLKSKDQQFEKPEVQKGILSRLWNFIKNIFNKANTFEVDNAISEAKEIANKLADQIISSESLLIEKNDILSADTMYHLNSAAKSIDELAIDARNVAALLMKERASKTDTGLYRPEDADDLRKIDKAIDDKKYVDSCCEFLKSALINIQEFQRNISGLEGAANANNPNGIRVLSQNLVNLKNFIATYNNILEDLASLDINYDEIGLNKEDGERIAAQASEVQALIPEVEKHTKKLTFQLAKAFLTPYWKDKQITTKYIKDQLVTIDTLLKEGFNDITFADSLVNSLSEASDILLALMAKIAINQQDKRDEILLQDDAYIRKAEDDLRKSGSNSEFIFEKDKNGKPTGYIISNRNTAKYIADKEAYIEKLNQNEDLHVGEKVMALQKWERSHTKVITVKYNNEDINVRVPSDDYLYPEGQSPLDKLTSAQKEYYDRMLALKAARESFLPEYQQNLYRAVQIRTDFIEELGRNIFNPKELLEKSLEKLKDNFVKRPDDTEFGSLVEEGERLVLLNAQGKPLKRVPIHYVNPLEDMSQLSMDFGASLRAFCGTTMNYAMMSEMLPQFELLNDIIQERETPATTGSDVKVAISRVFGKEIKTVEKKKGKDLKIGKASEFLMDKFFYGITKKEGKEITIGKAKIDSEKMLDFIKSYTSLVGMGLNVFSGISNITMGGAQMLIEAFGGENFGHKDLSKAHLDYDKDIFAYLAELNSVKRESKMSLLIDKFDALEAFYDKLKSDKFYKDGALRGLSNSNLMVFNEIGEHRLHCITMLAMLEHTKLKKADGSSISLYDALEVSREKINKNGEKITVPPYIKIKDGVTKEDGTEFTREDFIEMKRKISRVNRRLHGAYSDAFKGAIHQKAIGRLAMQFRQWMPGFYSNRFAGLLEGTYYDVELGDVEEGYYTTVLKFLGTTIKDLKKMRFEVITNFKNLTPHQQANIKKAVAEVVLLGLLCWGCGMLAGLKDDDDRWVAKMAYYQALRLKLEVGAGVPFYVGFLDNITTMMQSPAASIKSFNNIIDLFCFWNLCTEIQTGRYQGHSRYYKDFIEATPILGQARKAIDLKSEDYMFTILE